MDCLKFIILLFIMGLSLRARATVDLVPECSFSPDVISTTTQIADSIRVHNLGDEAAILNANMVWAKQELIEGTIPGYETRPYVRTFTIYSPTSLAAGKDYHTGAYYFRPYQLPAGSYLYKVTSDPNNMITESNEDNNTAECRLDIADGGHPNLIIRDIQTRERIAANGEKSYDVDVYFKNIGTGNAYFAYNDRMLSCGQLGSKDSSPSSTVILPGEEKSAWFVVNTPIPGEHNISCIIDSANKIPEIDEIDNQFQKTLVVPEVVGETGLPDLGQLECKISNLDKLNNSERVLLGFKATNIGTKSLNLPYNSRYAREEIVDSNSGITRTILSPFGMSFLPTDTISAGQYWGILEAGDYIYRVTLNPFNDFEESDLSNNVIECPMHVVDQKPDVYIDQVLISPEQPNETSNIQMTITLKNKGNVRANFPWQSSALRCPGLTFLDASNEAIIIEPGASYNHRVYFSNKAPGNYHYQCTIDPDNRIPESDENNNATAVDFIVADSTLHPDLIIHSGQYVVETGFISLTVKNQGKIATSGLIQVNISGAPLAATKELSSLAVGEERVLSFLPEELGAQLGQSYNLSASVDTNNTQVELDENNNSHNFTIIMPQPRADFVIREVNVANGLVSAKVKNQGTLASTPSYLRFTFNGKMAYAYVRALAINEEISVGLSLARFSIAQTGDYLLKVEADYNQVVIESDEANNSIERSFTLDITNFPDLVVSSLSLSSTSVVVSVKNQGITSSPAFYLRIQGYGSKNVIRYIPSLGPDSTATFSYLRSQFTTINSPSFNLIATVDYTNLIAEKNETNNARTLLFPANQSTSLPDLTVTNVIVNATYFKIEIKNISSTSALGSSLKASINGQTRYYSVPSLPANAVTYVYISKTSFTSINTSGNNQLSLFADAYAVVRELREDNNSLNKIF